jgi:hypothetical protein
MDEIVLKKIRFTVNDLSLWESFLTDVLDLSIAPTSDGLEVKLKSLSFELVSGESSPIEWEFNWGSSEREVLLSRWSFYQYRGPDSIRLKVVEDKLLFEIDAMSRIIVHFDSVHGREKSTLVDSAVRIF